MYGTGMSSSTGTRLSNWRNPRLSATHVNRGNLGNARESEVQDRLFARRTRRKTPPAPTYHETECSPDRLVVFLRLVRVLKSYSLQYSLELHIDAISVPSRVVDC